MYGIYDYGFNPNLTLNLHSLPSFLPLYFYPFYMYVFNFLYIFLYTLLEKCLPPSLSFYLDWDGSNWPCLNISINKSNLQKGWFFHLQMFTNLSSKVIYFMIPSLFIPISKFIYISLSSHLFYIVVVYIYYLIE